MGATRGGSDGLLDRSIVRYRYWSRCWSLYWSRCKCRACTAGLLCLYILRSVAASICQKSSCNEKIFFIYFAHLFTLMMGVDTLKTQKKNGHPIESKEQKSPDLVEYRTVTILWEAKSTQVHPIP